MLGRDWERQAKMLQVGRGDHGEADPGILTLP